MDDSLVNETQFTLTLSLPPLTQERHRRLSGVGEPRKGGASAHGDALSNVLTKQTLHDSHGYSDEVSLKSDYETVGGSYGS